LSGLWTIILFPVDCNYAFKHVGRTMMKTAEQANALAPEQYGIRKRHRSINLAVNKALTFDILRQLKRPGAVCSNDDKTLLRNTYTCVLVYAMSRSAKDSRQLLVHHPTRGGAPS
jgi:hypothetical protein